MPTAPSLRSTELRSGSALASMGPKARLSQRFRSLQFRLMAVTAIVLLLAATAAFFELTARERRKLVEAKERAAAMVTQLLAAELAAAIDFGDTTEVATRLNGLRANRDVIGAAVWPMPDAAPDSQPITQWTTDDGLAHAALRPPTASEPDGALASNEWLVATRTVQGPDEKALARMRILFSLRPENDAFRTHRVQLFWFTAAFTLLVATTLGLLARRYVAGPLSRLAKAATALAEGDLSARAEIRSNDEIGELAHAFNVMGNAVAFREERLKKEIELAQQIQKSILPKTLAVPGLELAALMVPATEVGGDYYDVLPFEGGCFVGIGDVAGHGLDAGLMMLMMQSMTAALVERDANASPRDVVCSLNASLFDNVRNRLQRDDHATLTLLRYERTGEIKFAGAHEEILIARAATGRCEVVRTPGTWVGGRRDIRRGTVENAVRLERGDVMLLYTDGVTETKNDRGEMFGPERLIAELELVQALPAFEIIERILGAVARWGEPMDDVTLLACRFEGETGV